MPAKYCRLCASRNKSGNSFLGKVSAELVVLIQTFLTTYEIYCLQFAIYAFRGFDYENKFRLSFGPINLPLFINATICGQSDEITISRSLLWSLLSNTMIKSVRIYIDLSDNVFREAVLIMKKIAEMIQDGYLDHVEEFFIKVNVDNHWLVEGTRSVQEYPKYYPECSKQLFEAFATKKLAKLKCFGMEIDGISDPINYSVVSNLRQHSPLLQKIEGFSHFLDADFSSFFNVKMINWVSLVELDLGELIQRRCRLNECMIPPPDHDEPLHSVVHGLVATLSSDIFPSLSTLKISATGVEQMFTIFEALVTSIKMGQFSVHKSIKTLVIDIDRIDPRMHLEIQDSYQTLGSDKDNMLFPSLINIICNNWLPSAHLFKVIAFDNTDASTRLVVSPGIEDGAFCSYLESYTWSSIPSTLIIKPREYTPRGVAHGIKSNELSHLIFRADMNSYRLASEYPSAADEIYDSQSCDDTVSRALYRSVLSDRLSDVTTLGFTVNFLYYMYTLDNFHSFKLPRNSKSQMNQSVQHLAAHCPSLQYIKLDIAPVVYAIHPHQNVVNSFFSALNECMTALDRNMYVEVTVTDDANYRELLVIINSHKNEMNKIKVSLVPSVCRIVIT